MSLLNEKSLVLSQQRTTAWDLIGFAGEGATVRVAGGRTRYEAVDNNGGRLVRLARLKDTPKGLRQINRYVDPDTVLDVVLDHPELER